MIHSYFSGDFLTYHLQTPQQQLHDDSVTSGVSGQNKTSTSPFLAMLSTGYETPTLPAGTPTLETPSTASLLIELNHSHQNALNIPPEIQPDNVQESNSAIAEPLDGQQIDRHSINDQNISSQSVNHQNINFQNANEIAFSRQSTSGDRFTRQYPTGSNATTSEIFEQRWYSTGKLSYIGKNKSTSEADHIHQQNLQINTIGSQTTSQYTPLQNPVSRSLNLQQTLQIVKPSVAQSYHTTRPESESSSVSKNAFFASLPEYLKKKLTLTETSSKTLAIYIRDYQLSNTEKAQLSKQIQDLYQQQNQYLEHITINGESVFRSEQTTINGSNQRG